MRITKVYTKTGDQGQTQLAKGRRISKASDRIAAIGSIDELNACLGLVMAAMVNNIKFTTLSKKIMRLQNELFDLGAQLAVLPEDRRTNTPMVSTDDIKNLEHEIDELNANLPALHSFILPGSNELAVRLHMARTVCRRAERAVVALNEVEELDSVIIPYLNRMSDWLFVIARVVVLELGEKERLWEPGIRR